MTLCPHNASYAACRAILPPTDARKLASDHYNNCIIISQHTTCVKSQMLHVLVCVFKLHNSM